MPELTGHCRCGAITYTTNGPILWAGLCHCDSCRRATSSPVTAFFGVPREGIVWTGTLAAQASSDGRVERRFCATCGTQLAYRNTLWPDESHLYMATLDDPIQVPPQAHFHWSERLPWLEITDDLPKYAGSADDAPPL